MKKIYLISGVDNMSLKFKIRNFQEQEINSSLNSLWMSWLGKAKETNVKWMNMGFEIKKKGKKERKKERKKEKYEQNKKVFKGSKNICSYLRFNN